MNMHGKEFMLCKGQTSDRIHKTFFSGVVEQCFMTVGGVGSPLLGQCMR
jgi:hypothetical protein